MIKNTKKKIYLDYAATTPVDPTVLRAMHPYFSKKFGNAGSLHAFGQEAIAAVDRSREDLARAISAEFREIIFTGSATEANNLALRGVVEAHRTHDGELRKDEKLLNPEPSALNPRIIVSSIEHESVLETARDLERDGVDVIYLPVDKRGVVDLKKLKESLTENTILVSVMYVNNEIGTVQPMVEIAEIMRDFREKSGIQNPESSNKINESPLSALRSPLFHCDASQAFQFFDCDTATLHVDLMTLSSHKIYGPKGAAALYMRQRAKSEERGSENFPSLAPLTTGGGQEFGFRSGTENVPAIVGFAKAAEIAAANREKESKRIAALRDYFWRGVKKIYPKAVINGVPSVSVLRTTYYVPDCAPHILNVYFPGHDAQDILTRLDLAGIAASSGSACRTRVATSSYVIEALGYSKERARSSVRFSFGRPTIQKEIDEVCKTLRNILSPSHG
jgi:cysteine desulfurase